MAQGKPNPYQTYREALAGDASVQHKRTYSTEKSRYHIHDEFEVLLSLSPGLRLDTGSKTYFLPQYTLLLFNNMDLHLLSLMTPGDENDRYVVYFKPAYVNGLSTENTDLLECFMLRPFPDANVLPLDAATARELAAALDRMLSMRAGQTAPGFGDDLEQKLLLADFLLRVNRLYREAHRIEATATDSAYRTVYAILNHLHRNYSEEISLESLSRLFYLNKSSLCALFREITGLSPLQYLINCRLMKARELLLNGMAVEEVCGRVGYRNLSHFSRAFKSKVGVSPKQYQMSRPLQTEPRKKAVMIPETD